MNLDVIRTLTIKSRTEGVEESTAALKGLNDEYEGLAKSAAGAAIVTETTAKRQLSLADTLAKLERQFNTSIRAQQDFEKVQRQLNAAVAQNPDLQERANAVLALARERYERLTTATAAAATGQTAMQAATRGISGQLIALAAGAGPVGVFLAALGPWGLAAAAGLGLVATAMRFVAEESARMGQAADKLKVFSDITGITIEQIQALRRVGSDVGVSGDLIASSFERLTANLTDVRRATGALYDDVQKIDRGLAEELRQATTTADAIDVLARAYKQAGDESLKASIARAAFGRGGASLGPVLGKIADAGGIKRLSDETKTLNVATDQQIKSWGEMKNRIDALEQRAKNILASIFTDAGLAAAERAAALMVKFAEAAKEAVRQQEGLSATQKFFANLGKGHMMDMPGFDPEVLDKAIALQSAIQKLKAELEKAQKGGKTIDLGLTQNDLKMWDELSVHLRSTGPAAAAAAKSLKQMQDDAAALAKKENDLVNVLGEAATMDQKRSAALVTLRSKYLDNMMTLETYEKAMKGVNTASDLQKQQAIISALGTAATSTEEYALKVQQLRVAMEKAGASGPEIARALAALASDEALKKQQAIVTALGTGATAAEQYKLKVEEITASMQKAGATGPEIARALAALSSDAAINSQRAMIAALGDLATPMDHYKLKLMELKQQLEQETIAQDGFNKGLIAASPLFQNMTKFGEQFTNNFVQGMLQGKSATESLHAAMKNLASGLASGAIAALFRGDLFTAAILGISALIASMFGGGNKDKEDKLNKAKETWEAMRKDIDRFVDKLSGNTGSVKAAWQEIQDEIDKFQAAAGAAEDSAGRDKIGNDLHKFQVKLAEEFAYTLSVVLQSWSDGFGADSDFIKSMENVKRVAEEIAKVLADIKFLYGEGTDSQTTKTAEATAAATKYLLSLITGTSELSEITKKLQEMRGAAFQLQTELEKLGYTSEEAAALIANSLTKAIAKLIETFYDDLERKINASTGKDYLNKIKDLIEEIAQLFADALALGLDATKTILDYYTTEILKIVDSSTEVTQAKQELIDAYNKEKDAIEGAISAIEREIESLISLKETISSMLDDITLSGMSAIERLHAMRARFASWMAAIMADPGKVKSEDITKAVESAKAYLEAIKEVQAFYEQMIQSFVAVKQTIQDIIDSIADSKLSPEQKLEQGLDKFFDAWNKMLAESAREGRGFIDPKFFEDIAKYGEELINAIDNVISGLEQRIAKLQGAREAMLAYVDQLELGMLTPTELAAEMRRRYEETLAKAMLGDEDALIKLTDDARAYIDALKAQSEALKQTSDQLGGFIDEIDKFRESLKVDSRLSILSPENQLAAAKARFEDLQTRASAGDMGAAGELTGAAKTYLDLAKAYYASSTAYTDIYNQVDAALEAMRESYVEQKSVADLQLEALQGQLSATQEVIDALKLAADVAQQQIDLLQEQIDELKALKDVVAEILETVITFIDTEISIAEEQLKVLESLKYEVLEALSQMAKVINAAITWQTIQIQLLQWQLSVLTSYVSQFIDISDNVKTVTDAVNNLKTVTFNVLTDIFNEIKKNSGAQAGGLIGMASGGMVGGGIWNQDSVRARFAGGGSIMLAGGEYVTTAPSVNANTIGMLDQINRTGSVANDNGHHFAQLGRTIARVASATTTAEIESNREEMRMLRAEVRNLGNRNATRERGTKVASG